MTYHRIVLILLSITLASAIAQANDKTFGLAMHGNPKYNQTSTHLDYANPNASKGGALKIAEIGTFDSLNPYAIKGQAAANMGLVYDRLMRRVWDEPFTLYPLIAERIDIPEDRSAITFHINPKARFHDGSPTTADDVLFSYETLKKHGRPNMRNIYKLVEKAEILDTHKIRFTFGEGYDRETVMILAMMPILSKTWWEGRDFKSTVTDIPLLNGPYRIKKADLGQKIIYERVEDYWAKDLFMNKGHYNFDTITYDYYRDDTIALESFKKGDLNLRREWDVTKWQTAYDGMHRNHIRLAAPHNRPERAHGFIFNLRRAPFNDINIRKALSLVFDDKWIAQNLFHGAFKRIESYYPNSVLDGSDPISANAMEHMQKWKNDIKPDAFHETIKITDTTDLRTRLRKATDLLEKSGWIIENGKRIHKDSKEPLQFELLVSTQQDEKIAITYQRTLERLGIDMHIRMMDSATFQKRKNSYDYDMISFFWQNSLSPGTEQTIYWSCKAADEPARFNFSGICNPALDHFAGQIANAKTYQDLTDYAHLIDRILLSEYIAIPLFYKDADYIAHHKNIKYTDVTATYGAVIESWWMDDAQ